MLVALDASGAVLRRARVSSAIDVQRDLQRIRELPGGYGDAHVVEQN